MRISDWGSDVCSSDLYYCGGERVVVGATGAVCPPVSAAPCSAFASPVPAPGASGAAASFVAASAAGAASDRKSVVSGKSVSVRVDLGGRRILTKNKRIGRANIRYNLKYKTKNK